MLKYVLSIFILIFTIFSITACGGRQQDRAYNKAIGHQFVSPQVVVMLQSESSKLAEAGSVMQQPLIEMAINRVTFSHDIKIDNPYGHNEFKAYPECTYICVEVNVKNRQNRAVDSTELLKQIGIDAYYKEGSDTYCGTDDVSVLGFYETLKPLATGKVYFLMKCPRELETGRQEVFLICTLQGQKYQYTVR